MRIDSRSGSCLWMKIVTIDDAEKLILGLQDEIRRSEESRYDHRLHGVLLVAYGMNCCQVADLLIMLFPHCGAASRVRGDREKPGATPPSHCMSPALLDTNAIALSASPRSKR